MEIAGATRREAGAAGAALPCRRSVRDGGPERVHAAAPARTPARPHARTPARLASVPRASAGFRSSFRDWAAERTELPREVCEIALAHVNSDRVEAAYRRSDLFDKRRDLMAARAAHVTEAGN